MGTRTSLNSGLPRRETWTNGPVSTVTDDVLVVGWSRTRTFWRDAVHHTPMTGELATRSLIGTLRAMLWTLTFLVALTPLAAGRLPKACRFSNGRRSPRSNTAP